MMTNDLFISYAHQGDNTSRENVTALVARLHRELEDDFRRRFNRELEIFFDREDIQDFDHWQVRCHRALRDSRFFIVCLSRSYLLSDACRWEWEEWCKHEVDHGVVGQGAASLWFVKLEDLEAPEDAALLRRWKGDLLHRFHVQCHEWRHGDSGVFLDVAMRSELQKLTEHVADRLRLLTLGRARWGNLPWPNSNFIGREPELANLHAALLETPEPSPSGIHGIGGMGKTALAQAFAYNKADTFLGGCWLLRCEGRDQLATVFRALASDLEIDLTDEEERDDVRAVLRVFDVLRPRGPALFLLDNVDRPVLLAQDQMKLLVGQPWVRVIYTTRLAPDDFTCAGAVVRPLDLDRLPENQAVDLIRRFQPKQAFASLENEAAAREIVHELSGLTLAVETAAVYLGQCDRRVAEPQYAVDARKYLNKLREDMKTNGSGGVMSQLREVTATLRPTLSQLDAPARTVLQIAALLAPDSVALPWVRGIAGHNHPELVVVAAPGENDPWTQLIRGLIGMRLFQPTAEPRVVAIHRILQRVLENELLDDREQLEARLEDHTKSRTFALKNETHWQDARWELEPFGALAKRWADNGHPEAAILLNHAGQRWQDVGDWSTAEMLQRRAVDYNERKYGPNHPGFAGALNDLAQLLQETNRSAEAEPLMQRALAIDERSLGPYHPDVARDLNNLAQLLQATNRPTQAEPLFRRALAIDEQSLRPNDPILATHLGNMALLLQTNNKFAEAEPLFRRALAIDEQSLGPKHPKVAICLNNLAQLLQATNRLVEAESLLRRALVIDEQSWGPEHPNVGIRLSNLALLQQATNRLAEAEPLLRRALVIAEQSLGLEHPQVATRLNNLAELLRITDRLAEAEPLLWRALAIDEQSLGPEHPNVAIRLNNLALLLQAKNQLRDAEKLARRAVAIGEQSLSPDHPDFAFYLSNLARLLEATGRLAQAESMYRRTLNILEQSLGANHPDVGIALNNLGRLLQDTNRLIEAEPLILRNVEIFLEFTRVTGHMHPHLQAAVTNYARLLNAMKVEPDEVNHRLSDLLLRYGMRMT